MSRFNNQFAHTFEIKNDKSRNHIKTQIIKNTWNSIADIIHSYMTLLNTVKLKTTSIQF